MIFSLQFASKFILVLFKSKNVERDCIGLHKSYLSVRHNMELMNTQ